MYAEHRCDYVAVISALLLRHCRENRAMAFFFARLCSGNNCCSSSFSNQQKEV